MAKNYDVIVIGTGTAASQIAYGCRAAGKSVAMADVRPFGGTCALRGCDPKKVLVGAAEAVEGARRMKGKGVGGEASIDWAALMKFKRTFTEPVPKQREEEYARQGIDAIHGAAQFVGPDRIAINGEELTGETIAIATGMRPAKLNVTGEERLIDSEHFLNLDELPPRVAFAGGGYIAFEFGHLAARAGARVTMIDRGRRPLAQFDEDLADRLLRKTRDIGIEVVLGEPVTSVEGNAIIAGGRRYEADLLVHAAGRVPDLEPLRLEAANVAYSSRGVKVDDYLQSASNPRVFAAGDCADTGNPALTPVAGYEGRIAAANIVSPRSRKISERIIPSVVFSIPPMARAGYSEEQAKQAGLRYRAIVKDSSGWISSRRIGEDCSGSKILIEEGSERIVGAHLLGHGSEEIINIFALAIRNQIPASELKQVLFSYPTRSSDIQYML